MKNPTFLYLTAILIASVVFVSGCNKESLVVDPVDKNLDVPETQEVMSSADQEAALSAQPTVATSTELETIDKELDETVILKEDFSDL